MKIILNKLIHFIIKNLITRIYSPHSYLMHKTYEHHVIQFNMKNTIIVTIKKVMSYSEINNVPYHINQLCTIPYAPTMYHTLYTNKVSYYVPILNRRKTRPDNTVTSNQHRTIPCVHPKPSVNPTSRHRDIQSTSYHTMCPP